MAEGVENGEIYGRGKNEELIDRVQNRDIWERKDWRME